MIEKDRQHLIALRFDADVISRTEEVLRVWDIDRLFAVCFHCGKPCIDPDLPRGKRNRKKLPAELFFRRENDGCRDSRGRICCIPCEDDEFQYGYGD